VIGKGRKRTGGLDGFDAGRRAEERVLTDHPNVDPELQLESTSDT
jgi:hypothetical protein